MNIPNNENDSKTVKMTCNEPIDCIRRLVMYNTTHCMLCDLVDVNCKTFAPEMHYGWVYCPECYITGRVKKAYIAHLEKSHDVPMNWIYGSNKYGKSDSSNNYERYFKFFRYSKKSIYTGIIRSYDDKGNTMFHLHDR